MTQQINITETDNQAVALKNEECTIYIDLGNFSYKIIFDSGKKRSLDCSNVEKVKEGTEGSFIINDESYIFGQNAKVKYDTNKICKEKKALLGRALYPVVKDKARVKIVTLLPLSLYINTEDGNREAFSELLSGKYTVTNSDGFKKTFTVSEVEVFCESFSSIITEPTLMNRPLYLVDLGGVDWSGVRVNGRPDENKKFNNTTGMNVFYAKLAERLVSATRRDYDHMNAKLTFEKFGKMDDKQIEEIKDEEKRKRVKTIKDTIDNFAREYIKKNIYEELERIGYDEFVYSLVFVGGGAEALRKYLEEDENATIVKDAVYSNVEGARRMSLARNQRKANAQKKVGAAK